MPPHLSQKKVLETKLQGVNHFLRGEEQERTDYPLQGLIEKFTLLLDCSLTPFLVFQHLNYEQLSVDT